MSNDGGGIDGKITWELRDENGELKSSGTAFNKITDTGDTFYGSRAIAAINSNGVTAAAQPTGMQLGTDTANTVPTKNGAGAALVTYLDKSDHTFDATYPTGADTAGAGYTATYKCTYAAGEATSASTAITEAVIVTKTLVGNGVTGGTAATAAQTIARVQLTGIGSKQSTDTLTLTWTHNLLGS